jgi:hypothetical protein
MSKLPEPETSPPQIYNPKKRSAREILTLHNEKIVLDIDEGAARKKLEAQGTFSSEFFRGASEVEQLALKRMRVVSDISLSEFDGPFSEWKKTEEARRLFEQTRAHEERAKIWETRSKELSLERPKVSLWQSFLALFTTSAMGLGIKTGAGKRDSSIQSNFRQQLITDYTGYGQKPRTAYCPILQESFPLDEMVAAHIFSYKHGQAMVDALFGKIRPSELFLSKNGQLINRRIERYFDSGVFVIVPDLPDRPIVDAVRRWLNSEVREYKIRIIDSTSDMLDNDIFFEKDGRKYRDLDGQKLQFCSTARPAARYLYFHYCLQVLRRAWRAGGGPHSLKGLEDENRRLVWATPGRYIGKQMLRAFVEVLGHEYRDLMKGGSCERGDPNALIKVATSQIIQTGEGQEDTDSETDDEGEGDSNSDY